MALLVFLQVSRQTMDRNASRWDLLSDSITGRALGRNSVNLKVPVPRGNMSTEICTTACGNAGKSNDWRIINPVFTEACYTYIRFYARRRGIRRRMLYVSYAYDDTHPSEFIAKLISRLREHDRKQRPSAHKLRRPPHNLWRWHQFQIYPHALFGEQEWILRRAKYCIHIHAVRDRTGPADPVWSRTG